MTRKVRTTTRIQPSGCGGAPADPTVELLHRPAVQPTKPSPDEDQEGEEDRGDQGRGDGERHVVVGDLHQRADLALPVLPERERHREEDEGADEEDPPSAGTRRPRTPVGEGAPDGRDQHSEAVPDGRRDPADDALQQSVAGQERRREREAGEQQRTPAPRKRGVQLPPHSARRLLGCGRCPVAVVDRWAHGLTESHRATCLRKPGLSDITAAPAQSVGMSAPPSCESRAPNRTKPAWGKTLPPARLSPCRNVVAR